MPKKRDLFQEAKQLQFFTAQEDFFHDFNPHDFECRPAGEQPGTRVREDPALLSFPVSTWRLPNMTVPISTTPTKLPLS